MANLLLTDWEHYLLSWENKNILKLKKGSYLKKVRALPSRKLQKIGKRKETGVHFKTLSAVIKAS